jgi:PilZ domain
MGRRGQARVQGVLPVRIWGTDRDGQPFSEYVCTIDISSKGTRLAGVRTLLAVGDTLGIQYRNRQARYRIKWIAATGNVPTETQVGVECLQPDKELWPISLPAEGVDPYQVPGVSEEGLRKSDHRWSPRFAISGKACVSSGRGDEGVWLKVGDISLSGCYLQTSDPLEAGHRVTLLMKVADSEIGADGIVRTSYPTWGMGIEFTFLSNPDRRKLTSLIAHLEQSERVRG